MEHNYIGIEHLLLGLLREEEGVAARALSSLSVTLGRARSQVEYAVGLGDKGTGEKPAFDPLCKKALKLSLREALHLGHNYIGPEYLLLGLALEREGAATRTPSNPSVDLKKVWREAVRMFGAKELEVHVPRGMSAEERALSRTFLVDLEYVYEAQGDDDISGVVDYDVLLEGAAQVLEREELRLLETEARRMGNTS